MAMAKSAFHPNAYLGEIRNTQQGLASRTKILRTLERKNATAGRLAEDTRLHYAVVLHHLRLLETERIVLRVRKKKPYLWELTGLGQQRLTAT